MDRDLLSQSIKFGTYHRIVSVVFEIRTYMYNQAFVQANTEI